MRRSQLFTKTRKDAPADEVSKNAQLLIKAGFIHKEMAGVYAYLPLGLKVLENIKQIIREEMNAIGGQEIIMTSLQSKELWEKTKRWDDDVVDVWFKSQLKNGTEVGFGWSHEEPITEMMKNYVASYRDFPAVVHQFQTKLRNELRSKSGIMRGREFVMNDMYDYHIDEKAHLDFYEGAKEAYMKVFERVGLGDITYMTFAAGGAFTKYSHEFQTVTDAGEDIIYLDRKNNIAINEEVLDAESLKKLGVKREDLEKVKAAEVGNIFNFGTAKCDDMGLYVSDENGKKTSVYLGSYGIGVTRLMGVIAEHFADEHGLVWPANIAPAQVYLASVGQEPEVVKAADKLYEDLQTAGITVLYDDRDVRPGEKFADADLIGLPVRLVVSSKTLQTKEVECKDRTAQAVNLVPLNQIVNKLQESH
jgi:prolyl-tRNA synthetase